MLLNVISGKSTRMEECKMVGNKGNARLEVIEVDSTMFIQKQRKKVENDNHHIYASQKACITQTTLNITMIFYVSANQ